MTARYTWVKVQEKPKHRKSRKAKAGHSTRQDRTVAKAKRFYRNTLGTVKSLLIVAGVVFIFWFLFVR